LYRGAGHPDTQDLFEQRRTVALNSAVETEQGVKGTKQRVQELI